MMVFLLAEQDDLAVPVSQHCQGGHLHPPHIQSAVVEDREQAARVDADEPVRLLAAKRWLAQKLEVSSAYISEVEANNKKPSLDLISKYSEVLGVNKSTIMYFDEEGSKYEYSYQKLLLAILEKITKSE